MRIIAKNHDYYDSAMAYGQDPSVVFERREEEFRGYNRRGWDKECDWPEGYHFMSPRMGSRGRLRQGFDQTSGKWDVEYTGFTVAFCGRLYPGIKLHTWSHHPYTDNNHFAYTFEEYAALLDKLGIEFIEPKHRRVYEHGRHGSPRNEKDCEEYFKRSGEDHIGFFGEARKPIVVWQDSVDYSGPTLHFNPELRKWSFFKVFDAFSAFQELDMFVGGVMSREVHVPNRETNKLPNPVHIGDGDMRDKKGFDDWSFKTRPGKKKRKG